MAPSLLQRCSAGSSVTNNDLCWWICTVSTEVVQPDCPVSCELKYILWAGLAFWRFLDRRYDKIQKHHGQYRQCWTDSILPREREIIQHLTCRVILPGCSQHQTLRAALYTRNQVYTLHGTDICEFCSNPLLYNKTHYATYIIQQPAAACL